MVDENNIEVGETRGDGLRYWRAKEAVRQAEAKLTFQASSLATLEARATSLIGWAVTGSTALLSALMVVAQLQSFAFWAAVGALLALLPAALAGAVVLFPGKWTPFGDPGGLLASEEPNELSELEAVAKGLAEGIDRNDERLDRAAAFLARGIGLLAVSPVLAAVAVLTRCLISWWAPGAEGAWFCPTQLR